MRTIVIDWLIVHLLRLNTFTVVLVGAGLWMLTYQTWLGFNTLHTEATVVRLEQLPAHLDAKLHFPRLTLRVIVDGRRVECRDSSMPWSPTQYEAGDKLPILFYPSKPHPECTIDSFSRRWLLGMVLLVCGLSLTSVLGKVWARRHGSPELQ